MQSVAFLRNQNPASTASVPNRNHAVAAPASSRLVSTSSPAKPKPKSEASTAILLLVVVLAAVASVLCYRVVVTKVDSALYRAITQQLHESFPDLRVRIGRVDNQSSGSILISDIQLLVADTRVTTPVLEIDSMELIGDLDIAHWMGDSIQVRELRLRGATVRAWPNELGLWSIHQLVPKAKVQSRMPTVIIQDGLVLLQKHANDKDSVAINDIQAKLETLDTQTGLGSSRLNLRASGLNFFRDLTLRAAANSENAAWVATGEIAKVNFSPQLIDQLPDQLAQYLIQLSGFECTGSATFRCGYDPTTQHTDFELKGQLDDGRLQDARLPYAIEGLKGQFFCNNKLLQLRNVHAHSSSAKQLELNADVFGFRMDSPLVIDAKAQDLEMDLPLYRSLPASWQEMWDRLRLSGRISGNFHIESDGQTWSPTATIECEDVAIEAWLFPYPISHIQGNLRYENNTVTSSCLTGVAGGQPLEAELEFSKTLNPQIVNPKLQWFGQLIVRSLGPVAIDEQLVAALSPRDQPTSAAEKIVRSFKPSGTISLTQAVFTRADTDTTTWDRSIEANILGGSILYSAFPYPIYDIRGRIVGQNDAWWLDQFEGRNDSGRILCSGKWSSPPTTKQLPFEISFKAFDVPIEEELQKAVPETVRAVWNELQPSGTIDSVDVLLQRTIGQEDIYTEVRIHEDSSSNLVTGRSLRIFPRAFPYWLMDVACDIVYVPGRVEIHHAAGSNGSTRVSFTGDCTPQPDGSWLANVRWLPSTRFFVEGQLRQALPKTIRDSLIALDFHGPISLLGLSSIQFAGAVDYEPRTSWDVQLDFEDAQLADGQNIDAMRGTMWVRGNHDGQNLSVTGSVAMDALTVRGVPVTRLRGPFAMEGNQLYFGTAVNQFPSYQPHTTDLRMTAEALAGMLELAGDGNMRTGKYRLKADLQDAELNSLLQEVGVTRADTEANCDATITLSGVPWNPQTYTGQGKIHLSDAKLFELPFMIRLLQVVSVNPTENSAFDTADIDFEVVGDRIPLQIYCEGSLLRLRGEGWTNLRRDINLELYSYVGRRIPISQVISPLLAESRYATFMMIEVTGNLAAEPKMIRRPFPQLEATLQQIFPEVAEPTQIGRVFP